MITPRTRALLDRYTLATRVLSSDVGERMAREAGQSVEFHDFRQYQPGDELRYVDWRAYARTGRLYTRLHQAERTLRLHLLLDDSASMQLYGKASFMSSLAQLLVYLAQRDAVSQVHSFRGGQSRPALGLKAVADSWEFVERVVSASEGASIQPVRGIRDFATRGSTRQGSALVLVLSDLLDPDPLRPALTALRARGFDVSFIQLLSETDLNPEAGLLELVDAESGDRMHVGPAEVRAYRDAIRQHVNRTRTAILRAGFRHLLIRIPASSGEEREKEAFAALLQAGIVIRR